MFESLRSIRDLREFLATNLAAGSKRCRARLSQPVRRRHNPRQGFELLEERVVPSSVTAIGPLIYTAFPGETNSVTMAPGLLTFINDAPNVTIIQTAPAFSSNWLSAVSLSIGASFGIDVSVSVPIIPFLLAQNGVYAPSIAGAQSAYGSTNFAGTVANAASQAASSVVSGASVQQAGNVFFKVAGSPSDIIDDYEIYQVVADPANTLPEAGGITSISSAVFHSAVPGLTVTGNVADNETDSFEFNGVAGKRYIVMLDGDPERDGSTTSTELKISNLAGFILGTPIQENLSLSGFNAVGAIDAAATGPYFVQVGNTGFGTGTSYRFVVLEVDPVADKVTEPVPTLNSTDVPKAIPDFSGTPGVTTSTLNVSGFTGTLTELNATLNISHPFDSDLIVKLKSPAGTEVTLINRVGLSGDNFTNTTLDDDFTSFNPISGGVAPFSSTFGPSSPLSAFNGQDPNGVWTLTVSDNAASDTGTLNSWSLKLSPQTSNDSTASAKTLAAGKFGQGQISPSGEVDFWKATGASVSSVVYSYVDTNHSTKNIDSKLTVLANDGTTAIGTDDNSGPPGVSQTSIANIEDAFDKGGIDLDSLSNTLTGVIIDLGDQNDRADVSAFNVPITIFGGTGDDTVLGGGGDDQIDLGNGNDVAIGGAGQDTIIGGAGDDTITGGPGDDTITGGDGSDTFIASSDFASTDTISGGAGDDLILVPGSSTDDIFTLSIDQNAVNQVLINVNGTVQAYKIAGNDIEELHVAGGGGRDRLIINDVGLGTNDAVRYFKGVDGLSGLIQIGSNLIQVTFDGIEDVNPLNGPLTHADHTAQLIEFAPDPFEINGSLDNDSRVLATYLGSGATLNLDPTIAPAGDVDFYQFVAAETGTLDFQVYFEQNVGLPGNGDLDIQVLDVNGNVIGSSLSIDDNERVKIPAVQGQTYFLKVFGEAGIEINTYEMSVVNTPAPVPFSMELDDTQTTPPTVTNSDTGRSQTDNITGDNTPTILLRVSDAVLLNDLPGNASPGTPPDHVISIPFNPATTSASAVPGFRVAIFDETNSHSPVPAGFAQPVPGQPGLYSFTFNTALTDGSHFLTARVQMLDPAVATQTGFGAFSPALEIVVDTQAPPTVQNAVNHQNLDLAATSDSGVNGNPATFTDRITNDTTPTFHGFAEANSIVRLFATNSTGTLVQIGSTMATPYDGTNQFGQSPPPALSPNIGSWSLTSNVDLNSSALGFTKDGLRTISVTFEDVAGNKSGPVSLNIFLDTQGPQVTAIQISNNLGYDLFDPKPTASPTPRIDSLTISLQDPPNRDTATFANYQAVLAALASGAAEPGHYTLRGDANGIIPIKTVTVNVGPDINGVPATATVVLAFFSPLPDDRFTLTVNDAIFDPAGNRLDGESNASEPQESPNLPSGDGVAGGAFAARFTVDSRPEIGAVGQGGLTIDINGNMHFDPNTQDLANRDLAFEFGINTDRYFSGKFNASNAITQDGFDRIGGYGLLNGQYRWLLDFSNDGRPDFSVVSGVQVNGVPFSGNFNPNHVGDEIGLFDSKKWYFDTNNNNNIDTGDRSFTTTMVGLPIAGDFDGDGKTDIAVHNARLDLFSFDLSSAADGAPGVLDGTADYTISFNNPSVPLSQTLLFPGVLERPFTGDFNLDGITDIGLMVPNRDGASPSQSTAEYYIFQSISALASPGTAAALNHQFSPSPLGVDLYTQFGTNVSVPLVGNFDPPVGASMPTTPVTQTTNPGGTGPVVPPVTTPATNPTVTIESLDAVAAETAAGASVNLGVIRIHRTGSLDGVLTVPITRGGTASLGRKFTLTLNGNMSTGTSVVFPVGQAFVDLVVAPLRDNVSEPTETVSFTLGSGSKYRLDPNQAARKTTVSITDNAPIVTIAAIDGSAIEPNAQSSADVGTFRISRTGDLTSPMTVYFSRSGSASLNTNFRMFVNGVAVTGSSIVIPAGQPFVDVVVVPINDKKTNTVKSVVLTLTSSKSYKLDPQSAVRMATVRITD